MEGNLLGGSGRGSSGPCSECPVSLLPLKGSSADPVVAPGSGTGRQLQLWLRGTCSSAPGSPCPACWPVCGAEGPTDPGCTGVLQNTSWFPFQAQAVSSGDAVPISDCDSPLSYSHTSHPPEPWGGERHCLGQMTCT